MIPNHVGIIADGNGRWAENKGLKRSKGHEKGFKNLQKILPYMYSKGVKYISAYLFSTENFKRSKEEVSFILDYLLVGHLKNLVNFCNKHNIKAIISGRRDNLPTNVLNALNTLEEKTKDGIYIFNICFNYGSIYEITEASKKIALDVKENKLSIDDITPEVYNKYLYQDLPPIDLLIRTSGEERISNFMLWQSAYAELYFTKVLFPDFNEEEIDKAIDEYTKRDRRFGGIDYAEKNH